MSPYRTPSRRPDYEEMVVVQPKIRELTDVTIGECFAISATAFALLGLLVFLRSVL